MAEGNPDPDGVPPPPGGTAQSRAVSHTVPFRFTAHFRRYVSPQSGSPRFGGQLRDDEGPRPLDSKNPGKGHL